MVVQTANRHALRRYEEFTSALETVRLALEECAPLVNVMADTAPPRSNGGWHAPTKKEVLGALGKAVLLMDGLRAKAKEYEKELIANGWRV